MLKSSLLALFLFTAVSGFAQTPEVISWQDYMSLNLVKRAQYMKGLSLALRDFEAGTTYKLEDPRHAKVEGLREMIALYMSALPHAESENWTIIQGEDLNKPRTRFQRKPKSEATLRAEEDKL